MHPHQIQVFTHHPKGMGPVANPAYNPHFACPQLGLTQHVPAIPPSLDILRPEASAAYQSALEATLDAMPIEAFPVHPGQSADFLEWWRPISQRVFLERAERMAARVGSVAAAARAVDHILKTAKSSRVIAAAKRTRTAFGKLRAKLQLLSAFHLIGLSVLTICFLQSHRLR